MFSQKVLEVITTLVIEKTRGDVDALLRGIKINRQDVKWWVSSILPDLCQFAVMRTCETVVICNIQRDAEEILCYWEKRYKDELAKIQI